MVDRLKISNVNSYSSFSLLRLVFWKSIHLEVASDSFCFLINSSWLLVFILYVFSLFFSGFNLYCWRGIHFSQNNFLIFLHLFSSLLFSFHFWFRDLLRELDKKYEVLLIIFFLLFLLFLVSEGLLFVSFFWTSFHSLCSPTLGICFGEGFYLPDPCSLMFGSLMNLFQISVILLSRPLLKSLSSSFHSSCLFSFDFLSSSSYYFSKVLYYF